MDEAHDLGPPTLPPIAEEIAEAIGFERMLELVRLAGGCQVRVPCREVRPDHLLTRLVGQDLAQEMVEHFAGIELQIPNLRRRHVSRTDRDRVLGALAERRLTVNEAARALGITSRHVYNCKRRVREL